MLPPVKCVAPEVVDLTVHAPGLELLTAPVWFYDSRFCSNVWGNQAALALFGQDEKSFKAPQLEQLAHATQEELSAWKANNEMLRAEVEVKGQEVCLPVQQGPEQVLLPGCPGRPSRAGLHLLFSPATVIISGTPRRMCMAQVTQALPVETHQRMVEMCNNHPMFQFLFDEQGKLLAANQRAMQNMKEHLGSCENYTLQMYLSMGECDGSLGPDDMYNEAMAAIFKEDKPCHRFAQLRWSKRHMGKFRWVLYEMWPLPDPVSHKRAVLVCEQNISQVKALEDQFKRQNKRLEEQLEEALAQRDPVHKPAIDIDTPADKTLKMLDKLMRGLEVSPREAMELRDAILHAGADLRQPLNLSEQLMRNSQSVLDNEVSQSLIQLLSLKRPVKSEEKSGPLTRSGRSLRDLSRLTGGQGLEGAVEEEDEADEAHMVLGMCKEMPDELMLVLAHVDDWQFDAFQLSSVTNGRPLTALSYILFRQSEIVDKWQLDEHKLVRYLMRIEDGYKQNPYHNRVHAADVLRSLHVLVVRGGLLANGCCDEVGLVACYLSAVIHDYEHRGVNNDFLIRMSDPLAVLYNDRSPMENHHLAAAFQLLNSPELNFMPKVSGKVREQLRKQVIDMVLATDMKQHFAIHSMFQTKMQLNGRPSGGGGGSGSKSLRTSPHASVDDATGNGRPVIDDDQKSMVLQVALKCADLGHLASPRPVHRKWVTYLEEEFFRQGDNEKRSGLSVSPLMDRDKNGITKSQVGFFDIVALPLFQSFAQAFPESTPMLDAVKDNYLMWREEAVASHASMTKP